METYEIALNTPTTSLIVTFTKYFNTHGIKLCTNLGNRKAEKSDIF